MENSTDKIPWDEVKALLSIGDVVCGKVVVVPRPGVYLHLDCKATGLIFNADLHDDEAQRDAVKDALQLGDHLCGVVVNFDDFKGIVYVSLKESARVAR